MSKTPQDSGKPLFVLQHLGAGDALLCNGLVRVLADRHGSVIVPAYPHNLQAVTFMFRDDPRIEVVGVKDSTEAAGRAAASENRLLLGHYSKGKFDVRKFDQEFYSQANVEFKDRWDRFRVDRPCKEKLRPNYAFVHEDRERGFVIDQQYYCTNIANFPDKGLAFFDWIFTIMISEEIHVINSSFLILIDSLPEIEGQKLFFHRYPRPTDHPTLRKAWTIIE